MKHPLLPLLCLLLCLCGCIQDGYVTVPGSAPSVAADTLDLGTHFTLQPTPTYSLTVRNPHTRTLTLSSVSLRGAGQGVWRLNADGMPGTEFHDIDIRPGDSIYIFVAATFPANGSPQPTEVTAALDIATHTGTLTTVTLRAATQDVDRLQAPAFTGPGLTLDPTYPHQVFDSLIVARGSVLTLPPGTRLHFHDGAYMRVYGTLLSQGTPEAPVHLTGDRTYDVITGIPFDLMASQWQGLHFAPGSKGNHLSHTIVRNTVEGVLLDSLAQAAMVNCRLRNASSRPLSTRHATLTLSGCEVAEGSLGAARFHGGTVEAFHCTFANYYLFTAPRAPIVTFGHHTDDSDDGSALPRAHVLITNSIIYGLGQDLDPADDLTGSDIAFKGCVFKSPGQDDGNFTATVWDTDPRWLTDRSAYIFDYRLSADSPLHGTADPALTRLDPAGSTADWYGTPRMPHPSPGAYQTPGDAQE